MSTEEKDIYKILKPEYINEHFKTLTKDQITFCLQDETLATPLLAIVSRLSDEQLQHAASVMTIDQVRGTIPKLQLQQTGIAAQGMNAEQIRETMDSLTSDDKELLMQNISLLMTSSNKDELQSFIAFLDPLALAMAVQEESLSDKIIESAAVMTDEQLRVVTPLLSCEQIRDLFVVLDNESQLEIVHSMIDKQDQLITCLESDLPSLEQKYESVVPKLNSIKEQLPQIELRAAHFQNMETSEHELLIRSVRVLKADIESVQQTLRHLQSSMKLPLKVISTAKNEPLYGRFEKLSRQSSEYGKDAFKQFQRLTCDDGALSKISKTLITSEIALSASVGGTALNTSTEELFVDDESATALYEAVKSIGNPDALDNIYSISFTDIITAGFRTKQDFVDRKIDSLDDLNKYIMNLRAPKTEAVSETNKTE